VRYLGEEGHSTPIKAAFAYCPAYDTEIAFARAAPFYSAYMTKKLIRYFLEPNSHQFRELASFEPCTQSRDLDEFHQHCYEMAGYSDPQEFNQYSNPMRVVAGIRIPLMVLNSRDDPICSGQNVDDNAHAIAELEDGILVMTSRGSHCAHFDGWAARPWAHNLMAEYLAANYAMLKRNNETH
jgi:predicted alpha/beta-fold hydrolase